jgi:hypothetical protein
MRGDLVLDEGDCPLAIAGLDVLVVAQNGQDLGRDVLDQIVSTAGFRPGDPRQQ